MDTVALAVLQLRTTSSSLAVQPEEGFLQVVLIVLITVLITGCSSPQFLCSYCGLECVLLVVCSCVSFKFESNRQHSFLGKGTAVLSAWRIARIR